MKRPASGEGDGTTDASSQEGRPRGMRPTRRRQAAESSAGMSPGLLHQLPLLACHSKSLYLPHPAYYMPHTTLPNRSPELPRTSGTPYLQLGTAARAQESMWLDWTVGTARTGQCSPAMVVTLLTSQASSGWSKEDAEWNISAR